MGRILAIESSCDDTSAAVIVDGAVLSNETATQLIHKMYGGIVPEVASRKHQINIVPVVDRAIKAAGIEKEELDAVAFTRGPGLLGSLIVGVSFAKSLALSLNIPLIEVNHMKAHIMAHFADAPKPPYPFLCLTVSGGHTQIVQVNGYSAMQVLGETIDDAAGEAFDKTGKIMGLDYPAGPIIDKYAQLGKAVFDFPEPKVDGLNFSFSGLKTSIMYFLKKKLKEDPSFIDQNMYDICASVQSRIVSILLTKLRQASEQTGIDHIAIAGGVSANSGLRNGLLAIAPELGWTTYIPAFEYCTDNAAMIGILGHFQYLDGDFCDQSVTPMSRLKIQT